MLLHNLMTHKHSWLHLWLQALLLGGTGSGRLQHTRLALDTMCPPPKPHLAHILVANLVHHQLAQLSCKVYEVTLPVVLKLASPVPCLLFCDMQPTSPSCSDLNAGGSPVPAAGAADDSFCSGRAALPVHHSSQQTQQQQEEEECAGAGGCSSLTPTTVQQAVSRVAALGGTAVRPQSVSRRMQPAAGVHRLEVGTAL